MWIDLIAIEWEICVTSRTIFWLYIAKILTQEFPISEEVDLLDMSYDEGVFVQII